MKQTITLPYPPSINHYYGYGNRRVYIKAKGKEFRAAVVARLLEDGFPKFHGPIGMSISVFPPDRRRRDLDNVRKALLDAMQHGGAYDDDCQIRTDRASFMAIEPGGKVVVTIWNLDEDSCD